MMCVGTSPAIRFLSFIERPMRPTSLQSSRLFSLRLSVAALAVAMLAACASADKPQASAPGQLPVGVVAGDEALSPFYVWNAAVPAKPGTVLRSEAALSQPEFTAAGVARRILYTSTDVRWKSGPVPVTGTLYLPRGQAPAGGWPIVAWGHGTLGVADRCAPSWTGHRPRDAFYMNRWLEQGFAVVATDYQGLGGPGPHAYLFWESEGRSILDGVRAALATYPDQLANQLVITGQSQGSASSLGASRLAPSYAPELKLRATIATGVATWFPDGPYQLPPVAPSAKGPARFDVLRLIGGGIPDGGPTADSLVSAKGQPLLAAARAGCVDEMRGLEQSLGIDRSTVFNDPGKLSSVLIPSTDMPMTRMPAPVFLGTGLADRTIPPRRQFASAKALCAAGNPLQWKAYPGATHNGIVNAAFDDELAFVRQVFANTQPPSNCSTLQEPGEPGAATPGVRFND